MLADKKKLLVVGVLVLAVLMVGVFHFATGSPDSSTVHVGAKKSKTLPSRQPTASREALNNARGMTGSVPNAPTSNMPAGAVPGTTGLDAPGTKTAMAVPAEQDFAERDPFDGTKYMPVTEKKPAPVEKPKQSAPLNPGKISIDPLPPGGIGKTINLPPKTKPADVFGYTLSGVITGDEPAAIFQSANGDQRLVKLGGKLDGDTEVVAIERGEVTVKFHGKDKTLIVGADSPTEKRSDEK